MKLHVWATADPESLAACWLVKLLDIPVAIIPSNNIFISPDRRLPCLVTETAKVSGYAEISHFLDTEGHKLSDKDDEPINTALLAYLEQATVLTLWTLFCIKKNYEQVTRPDISAAIAFPMQYNASLNLQRDAAARAAAVGITGGKKGKKEPGLSKLHDEMLAATKERKDLLKGSQETMRALTLARKVYQNVQVYAEGPYTPAQLLLIANLHLQTTGLPETPLKTIIDLFPSLKDLKVPDVQINYESSPGDDFTLKNYLYSFFV